MEAILKTQTTHIQSPHTYEQGIYLDLLNQEAQMAVVGLGYVGLPIALEFAKHFKVHGFDINNNRVNLMKNKIDPSNELESSDFEKKNIEFTADVSAMKEAKFFIVAVPTPVDKNNAPNLEPLSDATRSVASILKKGDYVVFESTVYPGCTEEVCVPILEAISGLKVNEDFKIGYSPERINPGDRVHTLTTIKKVVSGSDESSLNQIAQVYNHIIEAGVHRASSIKVAEASKVIENTQRDVNIALVNELSVIFSSMNIDTHEVLEAASTKWNFLNFQPGLVGGHCIGVDPYYLIHKAKEAGADPRVIESSRDRNDGMADHLAGNLCEQLIYKSKIPADCKILVQGITFKEDVSDIRNSKVIDLINSLKDFGYTIHVTDPHADPEEVMHEYGIEMNNELDDDYDAVIVAVNHMQYSFLDQAFYHTICSEDPIIMDLKKTVKGRVNGFDYMGM